MFNTSHLQELEQGLETAKKNVALRDALVKLQSNKDFKKLVTETYLVNAAADFARQAGDPAMGERQRADALAMALAPGYFKRFMNVVFSQGQQAEEDIPELEKGIEFIQNGGTFDDNDDQDQDD
ncbi:hypothetical protein [Caballeronia sp. TF1N1]|uniref:hypothetical protein n=1 Tax=Caballeronia sp. TF1N1 TaxID=2878153 RepID=UPI001FCFAD83|nr:hypothetical protein [Caballeronia sp. TF1N1]